MGRLTISLNLLVAVALCFLGLVSGNVITGGFGAVWLVYSVALFARQSWAWWGAVICAVSAAILAGATLAINLAAYLADDLLFVDSPATIYVAIINYGAILVVSGAALVALVASRSSFRTAAPAT